MDHRPLGTGEPGCHGVFPRRESLLDRIRKQEPMVARTQWSEGPERERERERKRGRAWSTTAMAAVAALER